MSGDDNPLGGTFGGDDDVPPRPTGGNMADREKGDVEFTIGEDFELVDTSVSCEDCAHFPVCSVFQGIAPMLADYGGPESDVDPPFTPMQLAIICAYYEPTGDEAPEAEI